jgi:hypothetical protein
MKLTKSQLRQIIKEEVQKELDENVFGAIKNFLTGEDQLSATDEDTIARRTADLVASGVQKHAAAQQAKKELKAKLLDRMGKMKPEKKYGEHRPNPNAPKTWTDFESERGPKFSEGDSDLQKIWKMRDHARKKKERGY